MAKPSTLYWHMRRWLRNLGLPGLAGLVAFVTAATIAAVGIWPLQQEVELLKQSLASQPVNPVSAAPELSPEQALQSELATFMNGFPAVDALSGQLDNLFALCEEKGLTVDKGQYVLVEKAGGPLRRFEVTLPVTGTYQQVRALIDEVLDQLPAAAVTDIALEREKISEGRVRADLHLVFFVRKGAR